MILTVSQQLWLLSGTVFLLAVASDLLDGALARRLDQVTKIGGLIDHAADATFVTITITCLALQQERSLLLPMLIILAFTQYVIDSRAHRGQRLIASRLGRYNGIGYFLFAGALLLDEVVTPLAHLGYCLNADLLGTVHNDPVVDLRSSTCSASILKTGYGGSFIK